MKTTTILTASGALILALAATLNLYNSPRPEAVAEKKASIEVPIEASRSLMLPVKDTHISVLLPGELMAYKPDSTEDQKLMESGGEEMMALSEIIFLEAEEKVELGFDVNEYLPADFQAVAKGEIPLSEIEYVETEDPLELGFDSASYLPVGFDPYANRVSGPQDIPFMEEHAGLELGYDVNAYLPAGFDPFRGATQSAAEAMATGSLSVCLLID